MKSPSEIARGIAEYIIGEPHGELESVIIEAITLERQEVEKIRKQLKECQDEITYLKDLLDEEKIKT